MGPCGLQLWEPCPQFSKTEPKWNRSFATIMRSSSSVAQSTRLAAIKQVLRSSQPQKNKVVGGPNHLMMCGQNHCRSRPKFHGPIGPLKIGLKKNRSKKRSNVEPGSRRSPPIPARCLMMSPQQVCHFVGTRHRAAAERG